MADMRQLLEEAVDEVALENRDAVKQLVKDIFTLTKTKKFNRMVTCKDCGQSRMYPIEVNMPDFKSQMKALETVLDQGKGKPKETVKVQVDVGVRQLTEMSLVDLEAEEQAILQAHPELAEKT